MVGVTVIPGPGRRTGPGRRRTGLGRRTGPGRRASPLAAAAKPGRDRRDVAASRSWAGRCHIAPPGPGRGTSRPGTP